MEYKKLNKMDLEKLNHHYLLIMQNKLDFAYYARELFDQDRTELMCYCKNELDMTRSSIYNYIHVGEVVMLNRNDIPGEFTSVLYLHQVIHNIDDFVKWFNQRGEGKLKEATSSEIKSAIKEYKSINSNNDPEESQEVIDEIVDDNIDIQNKSEKIIEKINELSSILSEFDNPDLIPALEIVNELQIIIGGNSNDK